MKRTLAPGVLALALGLGAVPAVSQAAAPPVAAQSPQLAPSRSPIAAYTLIVPASESPSGLIARVVLPGGLECPRLETTVQGKWGPRRVSSPMQARTTGATTLNAFDPIAVCEAQMPRRALTASIAGRSIPSAKPRNIRSIGLLGDSGCRVKGTHDQACNDPAQWPLARVASRLVADQPDVVVYLGDFFYRESACPPASSALCGGSPQPLEKAPFTDSAWGWIVDVLIPMAPMLQSTPIVTVRGNHEVCSRAGNGFFLMFDPAYGTGATCAPSTEGVAPTVYSPTTSVDLSVSGGRTLRLVNVDSANGEDASIDDTIAIAQRPLFARAQELANTADEAWLLTHRPIAAVVSTELLPVPPGEATVWSSLTQTYSSYGLLDDFDLLLSSHIHLAQAIQVPGLPGQLVLGNAGTMLDPAQGYAIPKHGPLSNASGQTLVPVPPLPPYPPIPTATSLETWVQYGYAMARPTSAGWTIDLRNVDGATMGTCRVADQQISCL
ncbi:MAG: metallophosphoesterase [Candidatus Nanopelagicales bacterium]